MKERLHNATNILIMLGDMIEKKLTPFERRIHKAVQDELIDLVCEANKAAEQKPMGAR